MELSLRRLFAWSGRFGAIAAAMFGFVLMASITTGAGNGEAVVLASAIAAFTGGVTYVMGIEADDEPMGRRLRVAGWILLAAGLLLPTSFLGLQVAAIAAAAPAAFADLT